MMPLYRQKKFVIKKRSMKKNWMIWGLAAMALMSSCTDQKTAPSTADNDTTSVAQDTASIDSMDLTSIAGTYEGTLPAADCPGIKTVLTIHADSTYQLTQDYLERKDGHDEASGVLRVLDGKVLVLERPSSGEQTYYKVKDDQHVVMTDSLGNEPEGETAKLYVLTKTK